MSNQIGKIVQVSGPVVDVEFKASDLPAIRDALYVMVGNEKRVMEVSQHIGFGVVRCIMLAPSEGLCRDIDEQGQLPDSVREKITEVTKAYIDGSIEQLLNTKQLVCLEKQDIAINRPNIYRFNYKELNYYFPFQ
mgnify:CR=1 FL=1